MTLPSAIPTAQIILHLRVSLNGMSVLIPEYLIEAVRRLPAVKAVHPDTVRHPATERSPAFNGARQGYHAELQHAIAEMAIELDGIGPHIKRIAQDWSDRVD
jgi:alkylation response protein AidB-like acyl-CoA dehydrogenase